MPFSFKEYKVNDYRITYLERVTAEHEKIWTYGALEGINGEGDLLKYYKEAVKEFKNLNGGAVVTEIKASFSQDGKMAEFIFVYRPQERELRSLNIVEDSIEDAIRYFKDMMQEVEVISVVREDEEY